MLSFDESEITAKFSKNVIRLYPENSGIYKKIQNSLDSGEILFHSYALPNDRKLKVLL